MFGSNTLGPVKLSFSIPCECTYPVNWNPTVGPGFGVFIWLLSPTIASFCSPKIAGQPCGVRLWTNGSFGQPVYWLRRTAAEHMEQFKLAKLVQIPAISPLGKYF